VRFSYPAAWTARHFDVVSTFTTSIVFLSTQRLADPCRTAVEQRGRTISCGEPLGRLSDSGVLVQWMSFSSPATSLAAQDGQALTVGGRRARSSAQPCNDIGGDRGRRVTVENGAHSFLIMRACWTGANDAQVSAQVDALLGSVRFAHSD
jgi:hypothetical protein